MAPDAIIERAKQAASHWSIITAPPILVMQRENIVLRVETTLGPHALRLHRVGYHRDAMIQSELDWMDMLARHHFSVPRPALADDGKFLIKIRIAGDKYQMCSLLSWLTGTPFGKSGQSLHHVGATRQILMADIGRKLARLHILSDDWALPRDFDRPKWDFDGLLGDQPFWGAFWTLRSGSDEDRALLIKLRTLCAQQLKEYQQAGADIGLIHADLARENILVDGMQVNFIDFDDGGFGYRMFDIATALIKNIREPDFPDLRRALLEAYSDVRPMQAHHLQAMPLFMVLRALTYLGWVDERIEEPGMAAKAKGFLTDVKLLAKLHFG